MNIGTNVVVRMPDLDGGRPAPRNVLAAFIHVISSGLYLLGTKESLLELLYAHNEFTTDDNQERRLRVASGATALGPALEGAPHFRPMSLSSYILPVSWKC